MEPQPKWYKRLSERTQNVAKFTSAVIVLGGFVVTVCGWGVGKVMNAVDGRFDQLEEQIQANDLETKRSIRRLELLNLIYNQPANKVEIEKVAHNYFIELGGDWYASNVYSAWADEYGGNSNLILGGTP